MTQRRLPTTFGFGSTYFKAAFHILCTLFLFTFLTSPTLADPLDDPVDPNAECTMPMNAPYTWTSGVVQDWAGRPIQGAVVTETRYRSERSSTDSNGFYWLRLYAHCPTTLEATHPHFETDISGQIATPMQGPTFNLAYVLRYPTVEPAFINHSPQKTVSLNVDAGPPSTQEAEVWAQLSDGSVIEMSPHSASGQLTRWTASWSVPTSLPDGSYQISYCVVTVGSNGNCDAVVPFTGKKVSSALSSANLVIDNVAPALGNLSPRPQHNTLDTTPTLSFAVTDRLSGVNASGLAIDLDGVRRATGASSYTPPSALTLGLHSISVSAADLAGNVASSSWEFNITTFDVQSAYGRLQSQTVDVNPDGKILDAPTSVTFSNIQVSLDPYNLTIGPDPYPGYLQFQRSVALSAASVVFTNETGIPSDPVSAGLPSTSFQSAAALILPETGNSMALVPGQSKNVGSINVRVPPGYNTKGSRAILTMVHQLSGAAVQVGGQTIDDPTLNDIPTGSAVTITLTASTAVSVDAAGKASASPGAAPQTDGWLKLDSLGMPPIPIYTKPLSGSDQNAFSSFPTLLCASGDKACVGHNPSGPEFLLESHPWLSLGDGQLNVYGNHWLYQRADDNSLLDWHQTAVVIGSQGPCLKRFTNSVRLMGATPSGVTLPVPVSTGRFRTQYVWSGNSLTVNDGGDDFFLSSPLSELSSDQNSDTARAIWSITSGRPTSEKLASAVKLGSLASPAAIVDAHELSFLTGGCS